MAAARVVEDSEGLREPRLDWTWELCGRHCLQGIEQITPVPPSFILRSWETHMLLMQPATYLCSSAGMSKSWNEQKNSWRNPWTGFALCSELWENPPSQAMWIEGALWLRWCKIYLLSICLFSSCLIDSVILLSCWLLGFIETQKESCRYRKSSLNPPLPEQNILSIWNTPGMNRLKGS